MKAAFFTPVLLLIPFALPTPVRGWTRLRRDDARLVNRSELIAVGRLKAGSIVYIPQPEGRRHGWEHHATLVVTEVLKGECERKEIPIIMHYGLDPVVGGHLKLEGRLEIHRRGDRKDFPEDIIEILDTGKSPSSMNALVKDAREDNLWFLSRSNGPFGDGEIAPQLGIVHPEDLQPLARKDHYTAYLAREQANARAAALTNQPSPDSAEGPSLKEGLAMLFFWLGVVVLMIGARNFASRQRLATNG